LIDDLAEQGFRLLILSGGEPLLRDDLDSLISYAAENGLYPVLGTNALDLTADRIESLKDAGLKGMGISLDSASPDIHDKFRGQEGAWENTLKALNWSGNMRYQFKLIRLFLSRTSLNLKVLLSWLKN